MLKLPRFVAASLRRRRERKVAAVLSRVAGITAPNNRAMRRVALFPRCGIAYNRIQKNANSTAMVALHALETGTVAPINDAKAQTLHLTTAPPDMLEDLGRYAWLVVIRDPYSRTLSAFLDKFRRERFIHKYGSFEITADGYLRFLHWLADGNLRANAHWNLQTRAMLMPLSGYSKVLRFESFNEEFPAYLREFDPSVTAEQVAGYTRLGTWHKTGSQDREAQFYSPEARRLVDRLFEPDFSALGYPFRP